MDEFLEGRSLELRNIIQLAQLKREGDSNEIFWFIKGIMNKQGTQLSLEEMQELYRKQKEEKENN